ncbi:MAG TPA: DUF1343 domain-containing protein [Thermomicrobiales bacterium]|nr:DUF1343 domain-containing protein [Thermomicrobiales bacterium]
MSSGDPTHWAGNWRMEFSEGELSWTSRAGADIGAGGDLVQVRHRGARPVTQSMEKLPLLGRSRALQHLVESIAAGVEPESSGRQNLGTVAIMEASVPRPRATASSRSPRSGTCRDPREPRVAHLVHRCRYGRSEGCSGRPMTPGSSQPFSNHNGGGMNRQRVEVGLEVMLEANATPIDGKRVGLVTNSSAIDRQLRSAVDRLHADQRFDLATLFGPEHGVRGDAQAGVEVDSVEDSRTGLPVYSLYGDTREPTPEMLDGLDALIFDVQDVPVRFATYISTLAYCQVAAASAGLDVVVLDRPNSLTGMHVEGNLLDPAFTSFVGIHPIVIRHGLTVGEFARLFAAERSLPEPIVVPMRNWERDMWFDEMGLPWVQPSPNLPTLDSVTLYPGTCLIEGTNISEGRGTARPFEYIGAPWIDPYRLAEDLERRNLPGLAYRPAFFSPVFSKHAGEVCGGVQVYALDRKALRPVELGIQLLHALRGHNPDAFEWRSRSTGEYFVDLLSGTDRLRRSLDDGAAPADIMADWDKDAAAFEERRRPYLLYPE